MKKLLLLSLSLFSIASVSAKKVKFAVDMAGQTLNTTGMHIWGDFQVAAGYTSDWCPNCTPLTQETIDTNIYSIVVDIPALAKYEFSFLNGDQGYDVEFVPVEARVGYDFNSNRWLYIDSLADDTTYVGAILFGGNAPAGLTLVRFLVNMQNETVSANGVHIGGTWQSWNPASERLYSFVPNVYEIIQYVTNGTWNYKFYNGNSSGDGETITGSCSVFGNREVIVSADIVLSSVCFSQCSDCTVGITEIAQANSVNVYPNPFRDYTILSLDNAAESFITLSDLSGRIVRTYSNVKENSFRIEKDNLSSGVYFVNVTNENNKTATKLVIE
jgi:alpha-amylase